MSTLKWSNLNYNPFHLKLTKKKFYNENKFRSVIIILQFQAILFGILEELNQKKCKCNLLYENKIYQVEAFGKLSGLRQKCHKIMPCVNC